jgi:hypothetical protein
MAIALIKYDLSDQDDRMEFQRANKSFDMAMMLWELMYNYKKKFYRQLETDAESTDSEYELIDSIFKSIHELAEEHNINIDELIN